MLDKNFILTGTARNPEQAVTASAATTNVRKLDGMEIGDDELIQIVGEVTETFTAAGAATLKVDLETDDAEGFGTKAVIRSSAVIPKATLVKGYKIPFGRIPGRLLKDYLRGYFTVATGPMTAGKIILVGVISDQTNGAEVAEALKAYGH
ncbi:MAG: hypothetical protein K9K66_04440 [Desulfarculaceae bacterium]|nr:hypothetical protein [Desulfarculaceae bacterium]MCF8073292.1 hypothetical protein [Desulfarculaceae bacterium]MCF8100888.1 hypothetical protein [Desulfarculaceae bacterium]MCF8116656.1 hypothetical protein [Desulfarculaceae bacterium]